MAARWPLMTWPKWPKDHWALTASLQVNPAYFCTWGPGKS